MVEVKKQILWKRFYGYLKLVAVKDKKFWIHRNTLFELAGHRGYSKNAVWTALERLEKEVDVCKDGGKYRYAIELTEQDKKDMRRAIKWFDKQ